MACDICGAKGTPLNTLLDGYRTADIQQICPACEKTVNAKVWKIRAVLDGTVKTLVRRYITERRASVCGVSVTDGQTKASHPLMQEEKHG